MSHLFCFGLGYSAQRVAQQLAAQGWHIAGTARSPQGADKIAALGYDAFVFDGIGARAPASPKRWRRRRTCSSRRRPMRTAIPCLRQHADDLARAPALELDRLPVDGGRLRRQRGRLDRRDDADARRPPTRGRRRIDAEQEWLALGATRGTRTQVFRLAGIYGPGRSAIDRLREGTAQRIVKPGQVFNRIHVDDIAAAVLRRHRRARHASTSTTSPTTSRRRRRTSSHMPPSCCTCRRRPRSPSRMRNCRRWRRSFYADNKRIRNARLRQDLGVALKFPTYREGLRAILADQPQNLICSQPSQSEPRRSAAVQAAPALLAKSSRAFAATLGAAGSQAIIDWRGRYASRQRVASVVARCAPWR